MIAFVACWEMAATMLLAVPIFGIAQGRYTGGGLWRSGGSDPFRSFCVGGGGKTW